MSKKICSFVISVLIVMFFAGTIISKAENNENISWQISSEGVLTISGNGEIPDYPYYEDIPWLKHCNKIKSVIVSEGITSISRLAFYNCRNLESVYISKTVANIDDYAFQDCDSLSSFEVAPQNLYFSSKKAFIKRNAKSISRVDENSLMR